MAFAVQNNNIDSGGGEPADVTGVAVGSCRSQLFLFHLKKNMYKVDFLVVSNTVGKQAVVSERFKSSTMFKQY